jgi:hypothetical protein
LSRKRRNPALFRSSLRRIADLCAALCEPLIPLDIGVKFKLDIWPAYHPDAKKIARAEQLIDWIVQGFDGGKHPWFRNKFVHPKDLQKAYRESEPLLNLFAGFKKMSHVKVVRNVSGRMRRAKQ